MESLLKKNSTDCNHILQKRQHSDSVGCHSEDHGGSKRRKTQQPVPVQKRQRINPKQISFFSTHNVNSLGQIGKLKIVTDIMNKHKILIMALQEIRNCDQDPIESQGYRLYKGIPGKRVLKNCPQFGNGFLINLKIIDSVIEFKSQSPRLATLTLKSANKT